MNTVVMNMVFFIFIILFATGSCSNYTNQTDEMLFSMDLNATDARKRYGYGFYSPCTDYEKTFLCMTNCKSQGYEVYRLDRKCKCTCHEMRSTTALPYYKWLTTGTPRRLPTTRSVRLYDVVGTLSPVPTERTTILDNSTCPTLPTTTQGNQTEAASKAENGANTENVSTDSTDTNGTDDQNATDA